MTPGPFDFRRPPPGDLERQAAGWLDAACRRAAGAWARLLPFPAELHPDVVEATSAGLALQRFPETAVAFPLTTPDPADGTTLLVLPRPLLLALLGGLLGETPAELPFDREPTDLEGSLTGYLARELFLDPLERAWVGDEPLALTAGGIGTPAAVRRGPANGMAVLATLTAATPFGNQPVQVLVPRAGRWEKIGNPPREPNPAPPVDPEQMAALVREMPVELAVVLGTAELTMSDVAGLRAGDLVVLRRKVGEPLDGLVSGARKFRVWPGAVGGRAAVQIHAPADE